MWQELSIIHGKPESRPLEGLLWRTCLRQIQFLPPGAVSGAPVSSGEYYRGVEVHRFLVEICAGLHSPLLGETEVFGQFRDFRGAQAWPEQWLPLLDAVEEDVKKIRRNHLLNLGSQSYGSLTRRHLSAKPVVVIGGGRLAEEILPWLEGQVTQLVRSPEKISAKPGVQVVGLADLAAVPENAQWIVAAPLTNQELANVWQKKSPALVLDFRGEESLSDLAVPYWPLSQLFAELETVRSALEVKREQAKSAVRELTKRRESEVQHRPYGWEDVFA
jgi:glutamyl-tRNA reductase